MKVKSLTIKNIGMIADAFITLNKPLILFYGEIQQGKTTLLNAVRYVFGGSFPEDIIRHGEKEASIRLDFDDGYVEREFYLAEGGAVKARALVLVRDGAKVPRPVQALEKYLNPFMLNQEHITRMTEFERKKFFTELFHTATPELDAERAKIEQSARELRATVKGYGDIQPVKVEAVNINVLREQLAQVQEDNRARVAEVQNSNKKIQEHNSGVADARQSKAEWGAALVAREATLKLAIAAVAEATGNLAEIHSYLLSEHEQELLPLPMQELLPAMALEDQISNAAANNVRAEQYEKEQKRLNQKIADEAQVLTFDRRSRAIRDEKIARLEVISNNCGVPGLKFLEDGNFTFEDVTPGMLSTSQLMRLSSLLSSLYPDKLGVELLDRGESLGKSIFTFVERAKAENKTILATIVGERPATVPENIGVFVVEDGKLS
jgi:predicted ATP-dependent endonuclease of OLD family